MRQVTPRQPRRAPRQNWLRNRSWPRKGAIIAVLAMLCGVAGFAATRFDPVQADSAQTDKALRRLLRDAGLTVRSITVAGRVQTEPEELLGALNVAKDDSILHVDLAAVHSRIASLPWVEEVRVSRNLPNAIHVELLERRPIAIWQRSGKMVLVDRAGVEITEKDVAEYPDLPLIVGKGAPKAAAELIALLGAEPQLEGRVAAAVRVGERRWNMRLKDGIDIRLPEKDPVQAWRKLARYEESNGLLGRDVELVDLRLADRVVVRLTQGAIRRAAAPERDARLPADNDNRGRA